MMQQINTSDDAGISKQILALATILYQPMKPEELVTLADQLTDAVDDLEPVRGIIGHCYSFFTRREHYLLCASVSKRLFADKSLS